MTNNELAFTALCNEYCTLMADPFSATPKEFITRMLHLLPRIYICASDLASGGTLEEYGGWINATMTEEDYESSRNAVSTLLGENDVYLEVFEEDMKYSDTPVSASISENLCDIYQALFDYLATVKMGTEATISEAVAAISDSFKEYWSSTLCNVMRALNHLWSHDLINDDEHPASGEAESMD